MPSYQAFRIYNDDGHHRAGIEELPLQDPAEGEVLIRARFSSVNYKDALAGTGKGKILRSFPLTGGIDVTGDVAASRDSRFREGDAVLVTNPFELFLDYGLRIKARSDAAQTMVVQLAGRGFYLPTARAIAAGGYGAMPAVSVAGPEAGARLVEETLMMIDEVMAP